MRIRYQVLIFLFVVSLAGGLVWSASHYHDKYLNELKRADMVEKSLSLANDTITDMQSRLRDIAVLDAKYTKEIADAKAENDALQRKLDNGGRVLVKGKCPVQTTTCTAIPSGVGNDATVELTATAGRNVLRIRDGVIRDQSKVRYLQDYIQNQCKKSIASGGN